MRRINRILIGILLFLACWWLLRKVDFLPSLTDIFKPKPVVIDKTPVIVKQIKAIAQLVTVSAYEEIVVDSTAHLPTSTFIPLLLNPFKLAPTDVKTIVLIGKATTHVGINMEKLTPDAIRVTNDSIHVYLPPAQILDVILNPSDVEIFIEKGEWDNIAVGILKNKIRLLATADVKIKGLLSQSERKAREIFTNFFKAAGYRSVVIEFKAV